MKRLEIIILMIILFSPINVFANSLAREQAEAAGVNDVIEYYSEIVRPYIYENGMDFDLEAMTDSIYSGEFRLSPSGIINYILRLFTGNLKENFTAVGVIILISVLCGFLNNMASLVKDGGSSQAAFYVCFCVICGVCVKAFTYSVESGVEAIRLMSDFVKVSAPALITLTAVSGQAVTAAMFSPMLYSAASVAVTASSGILLPLIYGTFSLSALSCVGDDINLDRMVKLFKNISKWIMGFFLTIFSGVSTICSITGGAMNAVAGKAIRFAVGNFIPLVGGMLSDSVEMAAACTNLVKKTAGAGGAAVIALIFIACGIRLVAQLWLFRLAAALTAPIGDRRIVKLLDDIADCISMVFASLCMCSFLFLVIITVMIYGGSA